MGTCRNAAVFTARAPCYRRRVLDPRVILPNYRLVSPAGDAAPHVWNPPPDVLAAGESAQVPYLYPILTQAGEQLTPKPALVELRAALLQAFPFITEGGMRRDSARIGTVNFDPHKGGTALDASVAAGPQRNANGDALANWLVRHMQGLQLQYIIWAGREISTSHSGPRWEPYTGSEDHGSHLHIEIAPTAQAWPAGVMAQRVAAALAEQPPSNLPRNVAIVGGVGAVAAFTVWLVTRRA